MREVVKVDPLEDYRLLLVFDNGEKKIKDMKPYLDKGIFQKLKNEEVFKQVKILYGALSWNNEIELCADSLYMSSESIE